MVHKFIWVISEWLREFKQLKNNKNIIITKSHKDSGVVILSSLDFTWKLKNILKDHIKAKHMCCVNFNYFMAGIELSYQTKMLGL